MEVLFPVVEAPKSLLTHLPRRIPCNVLAIWYKATPHRIRIGYDFVASQTGRLTLCRAQRQHRIGIALGNL